MRGEMGLGRALAWMAAVIALVVPAPLEAQEGVAEWAHVIAELSTPRWGGQRVEPPPRVARPEGTALAARSLERPLAVHAGAGIEPEDVGASLAALVRADGALRDLGWDPPLPDGELGGTAGFDLYLVRDAEPVATAVADGRIAWTYLDAASGHGIVDPVAAGDRLEACVTMAYAEAVLIGQDPAEAPAVRRGTAVWLTFLATGAWGCDESALVAQQLAPNRAWMADDGTGEGGALFLAALSERHDHGSGAFVHDVWQIARQRTWDGDGLRGSPDVWEAIAAASEAAGDDIEELAIELAVARFFAGRPGAHGFLTSLPDGAVVPVAARSRWEALPQRTPPADPPLEPYGSNYVVVDVADAPPGGGLSLWNAGEYGVEWSLIAIRLDANGRELGRMIAPPRRNPRSYLRLELEPGTAEVVLALTNLSSRIPDADEPDENVRSYRLTIDRAAPIGAGAPTPSPPVPR